MPKPLTYLAEPAGTRGKRASEHFVQEMPPRLRPTPQLEKDRDTLLQPTRATEPFET